MLRQGATRKTALKQLIKILFYGEGVEFQPPHTVKVYILIERHPPLIRYG